MNNLFFEGDQEARVEEMRYQVVVNADNKIHPDNQHAVDYKNYL